jgi:hypothetical protein
MPPFRARPSDSASASKLVRALCRWYAVLLFGVVLCLVGRSAGAHDLAIDQVMLWPDERAGVVRGELTIDPELTRSKDARPSAEHARRVIDFLKLELKLGVGGREAALGFQVRELWVSGGATLGDVVTFSAALPAQARELRVFAGAAFPALVVSVQRVSGAGRAETASWLLGRGEWTPVYDIGAEGHPPGWREGGPDVFSVPPKVVGATGSDASRAAPAALATRFVRLGFEHILPGGIDHVLFIVGLVLGSARRFGTVLLSLTLFTLAHTLTFALAHFEIVCLPARFVEPAIALSIFLVGVDNLRGRAPASAGRSAVARHAVVFGFGLIHGLGFAGALSELAFDRAHVALALLSFNLGVELGQIAVVVALGLVLYALRERRRIERYATVAASLLVAASGLFLMFERLAHWGTEPVSSTPENHRHAV